MGSFKCDLGDNELAIIRFEGSEGLSELFEYRLDVVSEKANIDFDKLLGTNCSLSVASMYPGVKRFFNGVLVEAQWIGQELDHYQYRLVLRPWLWLLTRTTNCRIFHEKSAPEIIQEVFAQHGFAKSKPDAVGTHAVMEYCVQYRESDYAFVSRLMEEYGMFYYFDHTETEHTMVLGDSKSAHVNKAGGATLSYYNTGQQGVQKEDSLGTWVTGRRFRSGKVAFKDYNYEEPTANMLAENETGANYDNAKLELYDYPGRYINKSDGEALAKVKLEAEQALDKRSFAEGNAITCCPGHLITLSKHGESSHNKEYVITRVSHLFRSSGYRSSGASEGESYGGRYEFQPSDIPFRAPLVTPKPLVQGPQTAIVVSEVDKDCRIKVRFHWQRDNDESRYVRIRHSWSGNGWGHVMIPRIDMEVIVEHLEGDPDQPIITGTVYNADNVPPYDLPGNKTISGVKSETYDGGGYNEFIFDDKGGSEEIRLHAERDMNVTIKNNRTEDIGKVWSATAGSKIVLTVGESSITLEPTKITIKSPNVNIDAQMTTKVTSGGTSDYTSTGPTTIVGAIVKIN